MIDVVHDRGERACGQVAFRVMERPRAFTRIEHTEIRLLDGSVPVPGSLMICGTCREILITGDFNPQDGYA